MVKLLKKFYLLLCFLLSGCGLEGPEGVATLFTPYITSMSVQNQKLTIEYVLSENSSYFNGINVYYNGSSTDVVGKNPSGDKIPYEKKADQYDGYPTETVRPDLAAVEPQSHTMTIDIENRVEISETEDDPFKNGQTVYIFLESYSLIRRQSGPRSVPWKIKYSDNSTIHHGVPATQS